MTEKTFSDSVMSPEGKVMNKGPVLIDFYADWCGPCKTMLPILRKMDKKHEQLSIFKVDVEAEKGLIERLGIRGIPAFYLLKDKKVSVVTGAMGQEAMEAFIDGNLEGGD